MSLCVNLAPLAVTDIDEMTAIENRVYPFPWTVGNFRDSFAAGDSVLGCREDGRLIGYFVLMRVIDEAHLLNISVDQDRQGAGYGLALLRHAVGLATDTGVTSLLLEVRPSNRRALTIYRRFGFQQIGVRRDYYPAPDGREDALVLRLSLFDLARIAAGRER